MMNNNKIKEIKNYQQAHYQRLYKHLKEILQKSNFATIASCQFYSYNKK